MIFTFYSYKGGVGRTMALANVAELLYQRGLRVLMVDFDLEAPGLEKFFDVREALYKPDEVIEQRGIIDLLISYKELRRLSSLESENISIPENLKEEDFRFSVEPITNFIVPLYEDNEQGGSLFIISPGCRGENNFSDYADKVHSFDWNDFYDNYNGEKFFEWFRKEVVKFADVVLIDSRTGITEMGGVCTYQLADVVVMFVAPNDQNIDGIVKMAESLSNPDLIEKERKGRVLSLVIVPSRVDLGASELSRRFEKKFHDKLTPLISEDIKYKLNNDAYGQLIIRYESAYSFTERVAVREPKNPSARSLCQAFENLIKIIPFDKDDRIVQDVGYDKLEELLKNKQFREASKETYQLMLRVVNLSQQRVLGKDPWKPLVSKAVLEKEDFKNFPCRDLLIINSLWEKYSNGKFGFGKQKEIWFGCGGKIGELDLKSWQRFEEKVHWGEEEGLSTDELHNTPPGHHPNTASLSILGVYLLFRFGICELEKSVGLKLKSEKGVDYTKLRDLLAAGKWKEANQETAHLMFKMTHQIIDNTTLSTFLEKEKSREADQETSNQSKTVLDPNLPFLNVKDIENFPGDDLQTIDQLWLKYSKGKFGFSVQKKIYFNYMRGKKESKEFDEDKWLKFCSRVGWIKEKEGKYVKDSELIFELDQAFEGHLPMLGGLKSIAMMQWVWPSLLVRVE